MTSIEASGSRAAAERRFLIGLMRAFGGAILFSLPLFMTMEMWSLGFTMDRLRLALLLLVGLPLLVGLSHYIGFEDTFGWQDDLVDSAVAYAVGFVSAGTMLLLFGVVGRGMGPDEIVGKVSLQAFAGAVGAMLAQNQFGQRTDERTDGRRIRRYGEELLIMVIGALFLALNVAPTEEVELIAYQMAPWQAPLLMAVTLGLMHVFVYAVHFRGQEGRFPEGASLLSLFLRYTVAGYALVLLVCLYVLWSFGALDGMGAAPRLTVAAVLGFPAAMGAAAARLIL